MVIESAKGVVTGTEIEELFGLDGGGGGFLWDGFGRVQGEEELRKGDKQ